MVGVALILSYLLGAVPFGVLVGKARGIDIRSVGSGNSGATNVWRTLGPVAGTTVFILDVLKGFAAPLIGRALIGPQEYWWIALCAAMAIIGHTLSLFLRFRGGKGIATGLGAALGLMPVPALITWGVWSGVLLVTRMISAASIAACITLPIVAWWMGTPLPFVIVIAVLAIVALIKHIPNMQRMAAGTEPKVKIGKGARQPEQSNGETTVQDSP